MFSSFLNFFRNEEDTDPSFITMTRNILIFIMIVNLSILPLASGVLIEAAQNQTAFVTLSITLILAGISLYYTTQGKVGMAKLIVPLSLMATVLIIAFTTNGLRDISMVGLPAILIVAALLLGRRILWLITPLVIIAVEIIALSDIASGRIASKVRVDDAVIVAILLLGCSTVIQILINRLYENIKQLKINEQIQLDENRELNELRRSLEERVIQRTAELDSANHFNLQRARQFEAITQVVRAISSLQDLDALLPRIAQVVSEQFNTYHIGIFLLDENNEFAVLRAANSEGGQKMLARRHKLQVGHTGIVGFVTATGQPRFAVDVGTDAVFFDNPDLPETRSEIALPLRYAGKIIGALDVQSVESNAFSQDDVDVLITLADQIAVAINNTVILEESRRAFSESQRRSGEVALESWRILQPAAVGLGFQLVNSSIQPLEKPLEGDYIQEAIAQEKSILYNPDNSASNIAIPIRLRGQVIGIMNLRSRNKILFTQDEVDIAEAISDRLSFAIETATLLQSTQRRADIERITTEISSRISSSTSFEFILQTAAQELSQALGGSDVIVQIEPTAMSLGMDRQQ